MKKAFTLLELIIVLILISIVYSLFVPNMGVKTNFNTNKIELSNLKEYLLSSYNFDDRLRFVCIKDSLDCFIETDNVLDENSVSKFFIKDDFEIYNYDKNFTKYELGEVKINNNSYDLVFDFTIDNDFKTNEFVLDTKQKVYLFNSVFNKPLVFDSLSSLSDFISKNKSRISDAF